MLAFGRAWQYVQPPRLRSGTFQENQHVSVSHQRSVSSSSWKSSSAGPSRGRSARARRWSRSTPKSRAHLVPRHRSGASAGRPAHPWRAGPAPSRGRPGARACAGSPRRTPRPRPPPPRRPPGRSPPRRDAVRAALQVVQLDSRSRRRRGRLGQVLDEPCDPLSPCRRQRIRRPGHDDVAQLCEDGVVHPVVIAWLPGLRRLGRDRFQADRRASASSHSRRWNTW